MYCMTFHFHIYIYILYNYVLAAVQSTAQWLSFQDYTESNPGHVFVSHFALFEHDIVISTIAQEAMEPSWLFFFCFFIIIFYFYFF